MFSAYSQSIYRPDIYRSLPLTVRLNKLSKIALCVIMCHKLYGLDNKECIIVDFSWINWNIYYEGCLFCFFSYDTLRKDQEDNIRNIKGALEKVLI